MRSSLCKLEYVSLNLSSGQIPAQFNFDFIIFSSAVQCHRLETPPHRSPRTSALILTTPARCAHILALQDTSRLEEMTEECVTCMVNGLGFPYAVNGVSFSIPNHR